MPYKHLTKEKSKLLNATLSDLKTFADAGLALLTGKASTWNDHAMAKAISNGKTSILSAPERRFQAFQSCLDRAATLIREEDCFDLVHGVKRELDPNANPADQLIMADKHSDEVRGQTMLANAFRALQYARGIFIECKRKFGDKLHAPASLTLEGKPKVVKDPNVLAQARAAAKEDQTLGALLKSMAATDPALAALLGSLKEKQADQAATAVKTDAATLASAAAGPTMADKLTEVYDLAAAAG